MGINSNKRSRYVLLFLVSILFSFSNILMPSGSNDRPFKLLNKKEERALFPVLQLISNIKNNSWRLLPQSFSNPDVSDEFASYFNIAHDNGGILEQIPVFFNVESSLSQSQSQNPDYLIEVRVHTNLSEGVPLLLVLRVAFFDVIGQYLIDDVSYSGEVEQWKASYHHEELDIPRISPSSCRSTTDAGFSYTLLRNRDNESAPIKEHAVF